MFRLSLLVFVTLWFSTQGMPAPVTSMEPSPKDLSYLAMESDEEMPELENFHTKQFGELRTVLGTIKHQFRTIIEEIISQVVSYFKEILKQLKVKLLRKLGLYSLSDMFRNVFDGVSDFLAEPVPDYYEPVRDPMPVVEPVYNYRPFSLASLLGAKSNS